MHVYFSKDWIKQVFEKLYPLLHTLLIFLSVVTTVDKLVHVFPDIFLDLQII